MSSRAARRRAGAPRRDLPTASCAHSRARCGGRGDRLLDVLGRRPGDTRRARAGDRAASPTCAVLPVRISRPPMTIGMSSLLRPPSPSAALSARRARENRARSVRFGSFTGGGTRRTPANAAVGTRSERWVSAEPEGLAAGAGTVGVAMIELLQEVELSL